MRKIREVLRLKWDRGLSYREIARSCSLGRTTVGAYLERARMAGLSWPLADDLDDERLERMLFISSVPPSTLRPVPDWATIQKEYSKKGVTLSLLWQEYKMAYPEGYEYSRFCELYSAFVESGDLVMRQRHKAGEKLFVDYAGQTIPVLSATTGETREAQLFLAVLGASNYTYAEATWTQSLRDWIGSHVRTLEFIEGLPEVVVPDNLKAAVSSPSRYDPELNPTYREFAAHYDVSIVPARVRKPRDKSKVETGVQVAERWILAPLRNRTFFDLSEVNAAIREKLFDLNHRPFQKLPGSRTEMFEQVDRPALRPLPDRRYEYAEWKRETVGPDYHVEAEGRYYSVPCRLIRQKVDLRLTATTIECFHKGIRVASHARSETAGEVSTLREHMPLSHQRYLDCTPEQLVERAEAVGPEVKAVIEVLLRQGQFTGIRSSLGVLRLGREYGVERLRRACERARESSTLSYRSIQSILKTGLDRMVLPEPVSPIPPLIHGNLRGSQYYS